MQKSVVRAGRPPNTRTFDENVAVALGVAVLERRLKKGLSQEALAHAAGIERSHMGKIERGVHIPSLVIILRLARVLEIKPGKLVDLAMKDIAV